MTVPAGGPPGRAPYLVVSVHDVAPATLPATKAWATRLADPAVPLSFLVVPGPWRGSALSAAGRDGEELAEWLRDRQSRGDEISLHGWCHRADVRGGLLRAGTGSVLARGAAEFWALDRRESRERAAAGRAVLQRRGLTVRGFTPPGWLCSRSARAGLADTGLDYVTSHTGMTDLATARRWTAPALCHRPARAGANAGRAAAGMVIERAGAVPLRSSPLLVRAGRSVRLALHPEDLTRAGLAELSVRAVRDCLAAGAVPATYSDILALLRDRG